MVEKLSEDYCAILNINLDEKLKPVSQSIDEMLIRLEEFETMIALVQQERCNSVGITGSISQTVDYRQDFKELCRRIDALEKFVEHVKSNISTLESKVEVAEKECGFVDNATRFKSLFSPLFKTSVDTSTPETEEREIFSTEDYFDSSEDRQT